jgi:hypothetical protein
MYILGGGGGQRNVLTVLVGKAGGKRRLVRPRRRWENNIKEHLKLDGRAWAGLIWLVIGSGEHGHITRG